MSASDPDLVDELTAGAGTARSRPTKVREQVIPATAPDHRASQEVARERAREVGAPLEAHEQPTTGGGGQGRRLLLIGLADATPELVLGAWRDELRTLGRLAGRGAWGYLQSSLPWTAIPAWLCLLSGLDPGQLGLYGPRYRVNYSYTPPQPIDSRAVREPRVWDLMGQAGKSVGVVGAPATTPAPAVHGHLIGDRALPDGTLATFPAALAEQAAAWLADAPLIPSAAAAQSDPERLIRDAYARTEQRFLLARRLLARAEYDCFVLVDDSIAALQRALWDSLDPAHPRYRDDHPLAGTIGSFYRFIDDQIAEVLELVSEDTIVAIASACGGQALKGELALNEWLIATGELVLQTVFHGPATLEECAVDWERTRAWATDGGAIYLNVAGREPQGALPADHIDRVRASIAERLRALMGPSGEADAVEAYYPHTLYATERGVAPDLLAVCTQPGWRPSATLGRGAIWIDTRATRLDSGWESPTGFLILADPRNPGGGRQFYGGTIYDLVPTLLTLAGQPVPPRLRGRDLLGG